MEVLHITDEGQFIQAINMYKNVIAYFSAKWCGPCKIIAQHIDKTAEKIGNKVKILKIDVEEFSELARENNVRNIPTFLYFQNGKLLEITNGVITEQQLIDKVEEIFN